MVGYQQLYRTTDGGARYLRASGPRGVTWWQYLGFTDATHGVALGSFDSGARERLVLHDQRRCQLPLRADPMNIRAALIGGALAIAAALVALVMSLVVSLPAGASTGSGGGSTATGTSARESAVRPNTCSATEGGVNQSISGRISGCLRVGAVASGRYTVVVDQDVQQRSGPLSGDELGAVEAKLRGLKAKLKGGGALVAVHEPAVTLALSPSSGPPGTTVRITGRLGSPRRAPLRLPEFLLGRMRRRPSVRRSPDHVDLRDDIPGEAGRSRRPLDRG